MCIVEKGEAKRGSGSKKCRSRRREPECAIFRGVRKRSWGRYVSEIRLPGQKTRIWLGSFGSAEMAARAYDSAAYFLKGTSAILNFPDLVESLPRPLSSSRRDIQSAAAKAAHNLPSPKTDQIQWWDCLGDHDSATTSFQQDVKEAPPMSPLSLDIDMDMHMHSHSTFPDFSWNQLFDFNHHHHDILVMESTSSFSFLP